LSGQILFNKICIIGIGLIGGSLARALRQSHSVNRIVGCGRNESNLKRAVELGVIDEYELDPADAVQNADAVVLAVPLGAMTAIMQQISHNLSDTCLLTDVGSAKASVVRAAESVFTTLPSNFVPAHPIAGTEKSGVEASFAELFQHRRVIITPTKSSHKKFIDLTRSMWLACGAEIVETDIEHHDDVLAATSHLPHLLAFSLVDTLARRDDSKEIFDYAAGGFRDFTRIASSDPDMWHDICLANQSALLKSLEQYSETLRDLTKAVRESDSEFLKQTFQRAKDARDAYCDKKEI
jgi:prephenate dehydrogenase